MTLRRLLGSLLLAASLVMACAHTAAATSVTSTGGTLYFGTVSASSEGQVSIHNALVKIQCTSSLDFLVEKNASTDFPGENEITTPAEASVNSLSFSECANNWHMTVLSPGVLELSSNGTETADVYSTGAKLEATRFGLRCIYATNHTTIGTLTSTQTVATAAIPPFHTVPSTLDLKSSIPIDPGSGASCGTGTANWTGSYRVNSPIILVID